MSHAPGKSFSGFQFIQPAISVVRPSLIASALLLFLLITGCAIQPKNQPREEQTEISSWTGRISLQVQSEPPQAFFAGFNLKGKAEKGDLTLISPIGNTLGVMRWSPGEALLDSGNDIKRFSSIDALLRETTGAAFPLTALFDWLDGKNTILDGWIADLTQRDAKKISAKRTDPAPQANLRIVLD